MFIYLSTAFLLLGVLLQSRPVLIIGGLLFLFHLLTNLVGLYRESKNQIDAQAKGNDNDESFKLSRFLEVALTSAALLAMVFDSEDHSFGLRTIGGVIWLGEIGAYILSGIVISANTKVKLKMGYGGWYVPKSTRRKLVK